MPFTHTLIGVRPSPRGDGLPFTKARFQEAPDVAGAPGTPVTVETITLAPVDSDPASPIARTLTTNDGALDVAWIRIQWEDAVGSLDSGPWVFDSGAGAAVSWEPTLAEVAAELRARTKDSNGNELGTFTTATRPTATQAGLLIAQAVADVVARVGTLESCKAANIADLRRAARSAAILRTAMRVERSFFPEQIKTDRSPYNALREEYERDTKALTEAVAENCGGDGGESVGGSQGGFPYYGFDELPLIGRNTELG